jgi:hypothetical protein
VVVRCCVSSVLALLLFLDAACFHWLSCRLQCFAGCALWVVSLCSLLPWLLLLLRFCSGTLPVALVLFERTRLLRLRVGCCLPSLCQGLQWSRCVFMVSCLLSMRRLKFPLSLWREAAVAAVVRSRRSFVLVLLLSVAVRGCGYCCAVGSFALSPFVRWLSWLQREAVAVVTVSESNDKAVVRLRGCCCRSFDHCCCC